MTEVWSLPSRADVPWFLALDPKGGREISFCGPLSNGDMIFCVTPSELTASLIAEARPQEESLQPSASLSKTTTTTLSSTIKTNAMAVDVSWDAVDQELWREKSEYLPPTQNGEQRHKKAVRLSDLPREPWDPSVLQEFQLKHMSLQSYLRSLGLKSQRLSGNTAALPVVEIPSEGLFQSRPSVSLATQPWRAVDNIVFSSPSVVEHCIQLWRQTGQQGVYWCWGRWEKSKTVPLGVTCCIEAVTAAQICSASSEHITMAEEAPSARQVAVAEALGLHLVGWLFTDLQAYAGIGGEGEGGVGPSPQVAAAIRSKDTCILSSWEVAKAASLQAHHGLANPLAKSGTFGSRFVTVELITALDGSFYAEGFSISEQGVALCADPKGIQWCRPSTRNMSEMTILPGEENGNPAKKSVDISWTITDEYGNKVFKKATHGQRFPIEYLLLSIPVSAPSESMTDSAPRFQSLPANAMIAPDTTPPVFGRALMTHSRDPQKLSAFLCDLGVVFFLCTNVGLFPDCLPELATFLNSERSPAELSQLQSSPSWQSLMDILKLLSE